MAAERQRWQWAIATAAVVAIFVLSCRDLLWVPMGVDTLGFFWMVKNLPALSLVTDPLHAGYTFVFFFEPVLVYLHYIDLWMEPWLGVPAHHLAALIGAVASATVLAHMVYSASRQVILAAIAGALFLFNAVVWFDVGYTPMVHYLFSTLFGLLSLLPAWNERTGRPSKRGGALVSALWYGLAVGAKESAAAIPVVILALRWASGRRLSEIIRSLIPHGCALLLLLAWRHFILGGMGGYFYLSQTVAPENLLRSGWVLAESLWHERAVVVGLGALVCVAWLRREAVAFAALAYLASVLPFALTMPLPLDVIAGGRLVLTWALLLLFLMPGQRAWGMAALGIVMLGLQSHGLSRALTTSFRELPSDADRPAAEVDDATMVSYGALWHALEHQLRPEPKAPFQGYITPNEVTVAQAVGSLPASAPRDPKTVTAAPLDMAGIDFSVDDRGRLHLRLAPERLSHDPVQPTKLFLALDYHNGSTGWMAAFGLGRERIDFPLNRSIRSVILFEPGATATWPMYVWRSPFFIDPYPSDRRDRANDERIG